MCVSCARDTDEVSDSARDAYDALAASYDVFTQDFAHKRWLGEIERLAAGHGLAGTSVLDVACGTGKSFLPLLERGYRVTACDISSAMLAVAAEKAAGVRLLQADMRRLPEVGRFDLVTCLDDALNYLGSDADVLDTLRGICRSLLPGGIAVWDVNTLAMYRGDFAREWVVERGDRFIVWRGRVAPDFAAGGRAVAVIEIFSLAGNGCWERRRSEHRQRHWPAEVVRELAASAGLEVVAIHGQYRGARLASELDESRHRKAVFVARRADPRDAKEVAAMRIGSP